MWFRASAAPLTATSSPRAGARTAPTDRDVWCVGRAEVGLKCSGRGGPVDAGGERGGSDRRRTALEQAAEAVLVEHRDAELQGLVVLASGALADDDVRGLLRHRARHLAT